MSPRIIPDLVKRVPVHVQEESRVVGRLFEGHHQLVFCQALRVPAARRGHQENSSPLVQAPHRSIVVGASELQRQIAGVSLN